MAIVVAIKAVRSRRPPALPCTIELSAAAVRFRDHPIRHGQVAIDARADFLDGGCPWGIGALAELRLADNLRAAKRPVRFISRFGPRRLHSGMLSDESRQQLCIRGALPLESREHPSAIFSRSVLT